VLDDLVQLSTELYKTSSTFYGLEEILQFSSSTAQNTLKTQAQGTTNHVGHPQTKTSMLLFFSFLKERLKPSASATK
jgi:hypothetical protein